MLCSTQYFAYKHVGLIVFWYSPLTEQILINLATNTHIGTEVNCTTLLLRILKFWVEIVSLIA